MTFHISKSQLCNIIWNSKLQTVDGQIDEIIKTVNATKEFDDIQLQILKNKLETNFFKDYSYKWQQVNRRGTKEDFIVSFQESASVKYNSINKNIEPMKRKGRPRVSFIEGSQKSKKRRSDELASQYSKDELIMAMKIKTNSESDSASKANLILAMYMDLSLSCRKYNKFRIYNEKLTGIDLYPSYPTIIEAKNNCYPENIESSEAGAKVHFISLLEHTIKRILLLLEPDLLKEISEKTLLLIGKWGMDGASGQQTTRQKWLEQYQNSSTDDDTSTCPSQSSDKTVFSISFVPIQLRADNDTIWTNERPSSVHFCRMMEFEFSKETPEYVLRQYKYYIGILEKIGLYCFNLNEMSFKIKFNIKCTMIDGKVCNILTGQISSSCCNICKVGPKYINDLKHVKSLPCNEDYYKFGLSTLHCWIRFMEYLLHVSYKLDLGKFIARTKAEKELVENRKMYIKEILKTNLSLPVDIVKQGFGTTNTGNMARSFFRQGKSVAMLTGLDEGIINRLHVILQVLTCSMRIDCNKFKDYCYKTAEECARLYGWYKMPPSLHKVLVHGSDIIKSFDIPFGWMSEEPLEGNNKVFRKARAAHSRMTDRTLTNTDILHYMLITSDPLVSSSRIKEKKEVETLSIEAQEMVYDKTN